VKSTTAQEKHEIMEKELHFLGGQMACLSKNMYGAV
jgi:hypothetical protein